MIPKFQVGDYIKASTTDTKYLVIKVDKDFYTLNRLKEEDNIYVLNDNIFMYEIDLVDHFCTLDYEYTNKLQVKDFLNEES